MVRSCSELTLPPGNLIRSMKWPSVSSDGPGSVDDADSSARWV